MSDRRVRQDAVAEIENKRPARERCENRIDTAVKRYASLKTESDALPPQAIIRDKDTWISHEKGLFAAVQSGKQEE